MIPHIIHVVKWNGEYTITEQELKNRTSWIDKNKDYTFKMWNGRQILSLVESYPDFKNAIDLCYMDVQKEMLSRYIILYINGGVIVDLSLECRKPINYINDTDNIVLFESDPFLGYRFIHNIEADARVVSSDFIASNKRNSMMMSIIKYIGKHMRKIKLLETNSIYVSKTTGSSVISHVYNTEKHDVRILRRDKYISSNMGKYIQVHIVN